MDRVPPDTVTSSAANPVVDSLVVKVTAMDASLVVEPEVTPLVVEAIEIVSAVASYTHVKVLETTLLLPAASVNVPAATEMV